MKKLLGSYLVTTICSWTLEFLIPLYVLELTKSAIWTSLTFFAVMAPHILITPFAGVWSDRYSKKHFLIAGDVASIIIACITYYTLNTQSGFILASALLVLNFLLASISATHHPMFQSLAPEILAQDQLKKFNSIVNAIDNIIGIIAPIFVATLLTVTSKKNILISCGGLFLFSLPLLILLPKLAHKAKSKTGIFRELAEGMRYVISDATLISFSLLFFCVNFGFGLISSNLIYIFSTILHVPQENIGYYYAVIGAGAITGSFIAPKIIGTMSDAKIIINCCFSAGILAVLACLTTSALSLALIWAASIACVSIVIVTFFTFRQKVVPKELLGRTVGVTRLISYLAIPPASIIGGILMDKTHSSIVIMGCGGVAILFGTIIAQRAQAFRTPIAI